MANKVEWGSHPLTPRIIAVIAEQLGNPDKIKEDSNIWTDLGADSLHRVEIIMEVEDEFDIRIPDSEAEEISTPGQLLRCVDHYYGAQHSQESDDVEKSQIADQGWVLAKSIIARNFNCRPSDVNSDAQLSDFNIDNGNLACAIIDLQVALEISEPPANFREWKTIFDIREWAKFEPETSSTT